MTAIQLFGSLLAVPVGIASAYSFYRANFSPDTTCQTLRSGIISLLDKSVDASTRRILVRRDVEAFEKACASVDPDATAAFKALLAVDKPVATAKAVAPPATGSVAPGTEERTKETVRKVETKIEPKIEPKPQVIAKQPAPAAVAATEPVRRDPAVSDAQWLDAVRQALVTHKPETRPTEAAKPQTAAVPAVQPTQEAALPAPGAPAPSVTRAVPAPVPAAAPVAAPALPPPVSIAPPPAQRDADHPVPPGSIPDGLPTAETAKPQEAAKDAASPQEHDRSRIGKWISAIPLLGPVVDNARR